MAYVINPRYQESFAAAWPGVTSLSLSLALYPLTFEFIELGPTQQDVLDHFRVGPCAFLSFLGSYGMQTVSEAWFPQGLGRMMMSLGRSDWRIFSICYPRALWCFPIGLSIDVLHAPSRLYCKRK